MELIKEVISYTKPNEVDSTSSKTKIYVNKNINTISEDGKVFFKYDQEVYTREEYNEAKITDIYNTINDYVDIDSLNIDETKKYIIKLVGEACNKDIVNGVDVTLSDGTVEHFSLTTEDQRNIDSQLSNILLLGMQSVAYHANGKSCKFYNAFDFIKIAMIGKAKILTATTYCNAINNYIRSLSIKDDIINCSYGMTLPDEYTNEMHRIIDNQINSLVVAFKNKYDIELKF